MRGDDRQTGWMFSYISPEDRVPADHPLRAIPPHDGRTGESHCQTPSVFLLVKRGLDAILVRTSNQLGGLQVRVDSG